MPKKILKKWNEWKTTHIQIAYTDFPDVIKDRIFRFLFFYGVSGIALTIYCILHQLPAFSICALFMIAFAIYISLHTYYYAATGEIREIECVILEKKRNFRRTEYLIVQDTNNHVYEIMGMGKSKHWAEGNIILFYTTQHDLDNNYYDGVYKIHTLFSIERINAAIENDEE